MKVTRHRKARSFRHKIHMPDGIWTYQVGSQWATIRNPECELTAKIDLAELTGWDWLVIDEQRWEHRISDNPARVKMPQVKPSDIRSLIENIKKGKYEVKTTSKPKVAKRRREGLRSSR